jgi:formate hydrogenlyase subunit 6/NADH:ubiquinone oxidoreductase subunit I
VIIDRNRCLPWAKHEACFVCEEECPYGAVTLMRPALGRPGVPNVDLRRCNGCGRCEDKCPAQGSSAIVVTPRGELRLAKGSYVEHCRRRGLSFEPKRQGDVGPAPYRFGGDRLPPGLGPR